MRETQMQFFLRRRTVLDKQRKSELCALYRKLGGLGGVHPPEKWRKDEVVSSIVDIEWIRLPEDQKQPDPPQLTPPCDVCGQGENATPHRYGGEHHYTNTWNPDVMWVPESEAEAERILKLHHDQEPEVQPTRADATAPTVTEAEIMATPPFPPATVPQVDTGEPVRAGSLYADKCAECTTGVTCEDAGRCTFEG